MQSNTSLLLILILLLLLKLIRGTTSSTNDFVFNGFTAAGAGNLSLDGLATVTSDGLVRLTNNTKQAVGHAFYPFPLRSPIGTPPSFSTTFVFAIVAEYPEVSGHGMAFAVSPSKDLYGAMPSQHLGLFNITNNGNSTNHIVAVELDTVQTVEFRDIDDNHVGIDINGLISVNASPVSYFNTKTGEFESLKLISGSPMQVWIDYSGVDMQLDVAIAPLYAAASKPHLPLVSSKLNLSSVMVDNDMYVGFSSSTGSATGTHYVLGWSFSLGGIAQPLDLSILPSLPPADTPLNPWKKSSTLAVSLPLSAAVFLFAITIGGYFVLRRMTKYAELLEEWEIEYGTHRFSYKDLFKATKGFADDQLLGVGGFGRVYRGAMPNSKIEIAVKRISHDSRQGMREFIAEIVSMGRLRHRNLVQLLGYCRRQGELLLVYDYMPNGSLDKHLFESSTTLLSWNQRFEIIKGVAAGLLYLHEGWEQLVIHRDIKAGNVLLDEGLNARLSDFGLARLYDHGTNPHTTRIVGTLGYLAPELSKTGKASTNTDVYAFGVFLLEVVCGRRPVDTNTSLEFPGVVDWVLECWKKGVILEARDPKLGDDEYTVDEVELVLKLGLFCCHPLPVERPSMKQVMQILERSADLPGEITVDALLKSASVHRYDDCFDSFLMSFTNIAEVGGGSSSSSVHRRTLSV